MCFLFFGYIFGCRLSFRIVCFDFYGNVLFVVIGGIGVNDRVFLLDEFDWV